MSTRNSSALNPPTPEIVIALEEKVMESTMQNPVVAAPRTKARTIAYWTTTILVAMPIGSGGVAQIAQYIGSPHGSVPVLGYPMYFFAILGFWKVLGAIAILVPRF